MIIFYIALVLLVSLLGYLILIDLKGFNMELNKRREDKILVSMVYTKRHGEISNYLITNDGKLLSNNKFTWELDSSKGKDLLICSDNCIDKNGNIVNSLRNIEGKKITINRDEIIFRHNESFYLGVFHTTHRHLKVI